MPEPVDDRRLGDLLLISGKLSQEALLACMQTQQQLGGPERKQLSEILLERGLVSRSDLAAMTADHGSLVLWCPRCAVTMSVPGAAPGTRFSCRQCGSELQPAAGPVNPTVLQATASTALPDADVHDVSDDIRRAMADPRCRIGRYVKLEELGRGGMGVVYRCYDPKLHREVAIKEISPQTKVGDQILARFKREAQACARLRHPGIVAVYEVGEHEGKHYLVMDLVKGRLLQAEIGTTSLSPRDLARVMRDLALALDHAHEAGIIHRDVKPENVIIDESGRPLLMDFGLARDLTVAKHLTQAGHVMGTPLYMAPEQVMEGALGPWTDIHALGAVLYHVLVGRSPYDGSDTPTVFRSILMEEPKPPRQLDPTINPDLETITLKCLEKNPDRRYPSGAAVAAELQRFLDGQAILARPIGRGEKTLRWARRNRALTAALAVMALVVVGAAVIVVRQADRAQREQRKLQRESDRKAARREERAKLLAERDATLKERDRAREDALVQLRVDVAAVLDRVRSGSVLADPSDFRIERFTLLNYREPETVELLTAELDALSNQLTQSHSLSNEKELFLRFLCETLTDLRFQEGSVESLGRYLQTELALPMEKRNQLRAVPAGKALCLLGGEEADRLLREARLGFGPNAGFWGQIKRWYKHTGVAPDLAAESFQGYSSRGLARLDKGDLDGAIADFTRVIELGPSSSIAWKQRGNARNAKGDLDGAMADFSRAIEIDPNDATVWCNRGLVQMGRGDLDGAIDDLNRAIEIDPNEGKAWNNRGNARRMKGDLDSAIADYSRALEIDPHNAKVWSNRGLVKKDKGDFEGAIADCNRAIEIDPNEGASWRSRGNARRMKGDLDGAIADYTRALEIDPNDPKNWFNRGFVRNAKGDLLGAIADWQRFLEIVPPNHPRVAAVRSAILKARQQQKARSGAGGGL